MTYEPRNLERWTLPDSYAGGHWPDYFVFLGQHRDSNALDRSNFECGLRELGGESETVLVVRKGHWAVGWTEWVAIHESDAEALEIADDLAGALTDYPVLDETHYSDLEWNEAWGYWERENLEHRIELCRGADISIFAARRDDVYPADPDGRLFDVLREIVS